MRGIRRDERGSAPIEFVSFLPYLIMAVLFAWQLLLGGYVAVNAQNAARNASRVEARGGNGEEAGRDALAPWLRSDADVDMSGETATVRVPIPIVFPGINSSSFAITRSATLPTTQ